jgi:Pin2-interacting protein X1
MTIISGGEVRNSEWANDTSTFGQKMLLKMGWAKGKGLGKNQQGTQTNLRALKREDGLGIGASTDTLGEEGFSTTSRNFHGVLANLQDMHGEGDEKKKKKSKKSKKKKKSTGGSGGLTLSQNRVAAGHAKKMREAKDLSKKSTQDMAAIFGMKVEAYEASSVWGKLSSIGATSTSNSTSSNDGGDEEEKGNDALRSKPNSTSSEENDNEEKKVKKKKDKKDKKKRKRKEVESLDSSNSGSDGEPRKKKKKKSKKS